MLQILMNVNLELQTVMKMQFALTVKEVLAAPALLALLVMEKFVSTVCYISYTYTYDSTLIIKMYTGDLNWVFSLFKPVIYWNIGVESCSILITIVRLSSSFLYTNIYNIIIMYSV